MTTHTITLARHTAQVVGLMGALVLGTWDSYGTEQLLLRHGPEWDGLAIDATFHNTPNDEGVTMLADADGLVPVPPEACMRASKYATITFRGVQDGVQRISCNLPYMVLDHAQVPGANSTATPSENAQALAQMQDLRDGAVDAKIQAEAARDDAANSAVAAKKSETNAGQSATAAAKSAVAAKESETNAGQSATAAAKSAAAAKESETSAGQSATALQKRQNVLVGSETGNPIDVDDAFAAPLCGLTVYGRSTQDGTPTPDAPVPIVSAGDGGTIAVTLSDGNGKMQTLTLPTPNGLPGIPVASGGNYTDPQGQQWVCDEVDLERGVKVQRVKVLDLLDSNGFDNDRTWHINTKINFGAGTSYIPVEWFTPVTKCLCNTFPVQMNKYQTGTDADSSIYYSRTGDVISLKSALFNPKGQHATVSEAKAWFTAHPTYLYVPIEPIETTLTPAEIAAYKALTAYAPDTVVQASDGAGVKLEYQRDVNRVVKNLEDAIASMTTT